MRIGRTVTCAVIALAVLAAKPVRNWQTGTLLDSERSSVYLGTISSTNSSGNLNASTNTSGNTSYTTGTYSGGSRSSSRPIYALQEMHVIESESYVYIVSRILYWRWSKTADVAVNGPVRFAVDKQTMYLLDDENREHKTQIIKRILRTPSAIDPTPRQPAVQTSLASSQDTSQVTPNLPEPAVWNAATTDGQFPRLWKSATSPERYSVRLDGSYLYAELTLPDVERTWNLFTKIETQKSGTIYVGKAHWAGSCGTTSCPFDDQIEFTLITPTRIEGAMLSHPADAQLDCRKCQFSKPKQIIKFVWIPQ
jgi:hypothetical protein